MHALPGCGELPDAISAMGLELTFDLRGIPPCVTHPTCQQNIAVVKFLHDGECIIERQTFLRFFCICLKMQPGYYQIHVFTLGCVPRTL